MPRRPRVHVPGGFYHVTLRGNHRQQIFFSERDRQLLADLVREVIDRCRGRVHAYCWMPNHVHLIVEVSDTPLGRIILPVASRYAHRVQAHLATTGHLFERRYHAVLVDADSYLLELLRYVHLNPVRAGLCTNARDYRWSSHQTYLGEREEPWVTIDFALAMFHPVRERAIAAYRRFLEAEDVPQGITELAPNAKEPRVLGDDTFLARMPIAARPRRSRVTLEQLIEHTCCELGLRADDLASPARVRRLTHARVTVAQRAIAEGIASVSEVARAFGRDESTLRKSLSSHQGRPNPRNPRPGT